MERDQIMAVLEQLLEQMLSGATGHANDTPTGALVRSLFHGLPGGMNSSGVGGVAGLLNQFEMAGYGDIIQSWIGTGENKPVTPEQLRQIFGADRIKAMSQGSDLDADTLLMQLSMLLPGMVDRMTPGGHLPGETGPGAPQSPSSAA